MEEKNGTVTKPKPTEPTGKMQFKFWYWKYWKSHTRKVLPPLQTIKRKCRALIGIITWAGTELFYFWDFWTIIRFVGHQWYSTNAHPAVWYFQFIEAIQPILPNISACEEGPGIFAKAMALGSLLLVIFSLPVSLFFVVKVVQVWREGGIERGRAEINLNA